MDNSISSLKFINYDDMIPILENILNNNPYKLNSIQHYLWIEFTQKNIPFLIVFCNYISGQYHSKNIQNILFTTRDCIFLKQLFNKLYPEIKSDTFYSSRALYLFPTTDYEKYCRNILAQDSLVIDLQGTGQSFKTLVSHLNLYPWYLLVNWNSVAKLNYSQTYLHDYNKKIIIRQKNFFDDAIEKLNVDLTGTYFDYYNNKPISYTYEYDKNIIDSLHKCFDYFMHTIDDNTTKLIKRYQWTKKFNEWMDTYYTNDSIINQIKWVHTHFIYEKDNIERIRNEYRNANFC